MADNTFIRAPRPQDLPAEGRARPAAIAFAAFPAADSRQGRRTPQGMSLARSLAMPTPSLLRALAVALATFASSGVALASDALPRLFGATVSSAAFAPGETDRSTVRERAVRPDLAAVDRLAGDHVEGRAPQRFLLDLFPGLDLEADVIGAEVRPTGTTVFARLVGIDLGTAILTHEGGVLIATVDFPGGNYTIERGAGGTYRLAQRAAQFAPPEAPPRLHFASAGPALPDLAEADVPADSGRLIDVMIVWTPAAEVSAGGAVALQSLAQASIDNANLTYLNSGVAQRLRLVHRQQVTYTERTNCPGGGTKFDCALDDISNGVVPNVHALRDQHGADLVSFFIEDNAYCGLAWLPYPSAATAGQGYSVLYWNGCPVANKSFVHELGHNMGAHHDPYVAPEAGAFAYSHGMVDLVNRWRTVLAYNTHCVDNGFNCSRVQYLSNPKLAINSAALGDAGARNNAYTLNRTAKAVAAYRPTSPLHPVPQRFTDVATSHPLYGHIEFFAQAGLTSGCAPGRYCPDDVVTRRQMAAFLERAMRASNWTAPAAVGLFADVPAGAMLRNEIEALRNDGVTTGCTATTFCPDLPVTRAQMTAFILRARCGGSYAPNPPATPTFADVPATHALYRFVEKVSALGITTGCASAPLRFCPDSPVTRAQMAIFIERAYPFPTPTEACAP